MYNFLKRIIKAVTTTAEEQELERLVNKIIELQCKNATLKHERRLLMIQHEKLMKEQHYNLLEIRAMKAQVDKLREEIKPIISE